jgi:hypothetical protein
MIVAEVLAVTPCDNSVEKVGKRSLYGAIASVDGPVKRQQVHQQIYATSDHVRGRLTDSEMTG